MRKIRCAILGAGTPNIATNHQLPATLRAPHLELAALADIAPGVKEYAERHHVRAYFDYRELLADDSVELIQIATPDLYHTSQALDALEAGKWVVLQKPPCTTRRELELLRDAARRHPGKLHILLNNRETPLVRTLRRAVADGKIGQLRVMHLQYRGRRFPITNPDSFYLKRESGGVWMHNALHWLDELHAISGLLPQCVQCFSARNDHGAPEYLGEGDNYHNALFQFGSIPARLEYNTMLLQDNMPSGIRRAFIGTGGELRVEFGSGKIVLYPTGSDVLEEIPLLPEIHLPGDPAVDSFAIALENFARRILGETSDAPDTGAVLTLTSALLAARDAAEQQNLQEIR